MENVYCTGGTILLTELIDLRVVLTNRHTYTVSVPKLALQTNGRSRFSQILTDDIFTHAVSLIRRCMIGV